MDADTFSVRWTGQIQAKYSQTQTFRVLSDEGVRLWVDGQLIIDDWTPHSRRVHTGTINLVAGRFYDIRVDYFEKTGDARIELSWLAPSQAIEVISADRLYESPAGLLGAYTDATGGGLWRVDAGVDFDWGTGSPDAAIDSDGFRVTWAGQIRADFHEEYTFSVTSDDGVRLWIGNELVIDNWTNQSGAEAVGTKLLEAGKWTDIRLEYYDNVGQANVELRWSSPRQTGEGMFEVVPQESLRATRHMPVTFKNPLGTGADPFVIQWQGNYYMSRSTGGAVWINRAESLQDIHHNSLGSDTVLAWDPPSGTNYSQEIWAPELHRIGESWYIYVAASNGTNATHRMHVLERTAARSIRSVCLQRPDRSPDRSLGDRRHRVRMGGLHVLCLVRLARFLQRPAEPVHRPDAEPVDAAHRPRAPQRSAIRLGNARIGDQRGPADSHRERQAAHHLLGERLLDAAIRAWPFDL